MLKKRFFFFQKNLSGTRYWKKINLSMIKVKETTQGHVNYDFNLDVFRYDLVLLRPNVPVKFSAVRKQIKATAAVLWEVDVSCLRPGPGDSGV